MTDKKEQTWQERNLEMQANGVAFEIENCAGMWVKSHLLFTGLKDWYRIAAEQTPEGIRYLDNMKSPEENKKQQTTWNLDVDAILNPPPLIPHIAERRLWLDQMESGKPVEWLEFNDKGELFHTYGAGCQPGWEFQFTYKPKPKPVKHYFALLKDDRQNIIRAWNGSSESDVLNYAAGCSLTIIGDIEEREVEV